MAADGYVFAGRYLGVGSPRKLLTPAEARDLTDAGVAIVSLVEGAVNGAMGGFSAGRTHATSAGTHGQQCGMPAGRPYMFAVDFDATDAQMSTVARYFEGVSEVLPHGQVGAYGGVRQLRWLFDRGLIAWGFQTYAWSTGRWEQRARLRQIHNGVAYHGSTVDLCVAVAEDYGQWYVGGTGPSRMEDDMLTQAEHNALVDTLNIVTAIANGSDSAPVHDKDGVVNLSGFYAKVADAVAHKLDITTTVEATPEALRQIADTVRDAIQGEVSNLATREDVGKALDRAADVFVQD